METLQIYVVDEIHVYDVVVQVVEVIQEFFRWIGQVFNQIIPEQEERSPEEGRAPPTLSINVSEVVKTTDRPFGS